ncbi:MAG: DUF3135 domain-containing protein [Pseudomonadota bacterium]
MHDLPDSQSFDFDAWAKLFVKDPEEFEKQRLIAIEQLIQQAPPHKQQRLRCLQWKLDQVRRIAPNPLAASLRMNELLWESLAGPDGLIERLNRPRPQRQPPRRARVLPFPAGLSQPQD